MPVSEANVRYVDEAYSRWFLKVLNQKIKIFPNVLNGKLPHLGICVWERMRVCGLWVCLSNYIIAEIGYIFCADDTEESNFTPLPNLAHCPVCTRKDISIRWSVSYMIGMILRWSVSYMISTVFVYPFFYPDICPGKAHLLSFEYS